MAAGLAILTLSKALSQAYLPDPSFSTGTGFSSGAATGIPCEVRKIIQQPDGRLIAGGIFATFNGVSRSSITRLNVSGSIDPTFAPGTGFMNAGNNPGSIYNMALQPDGKILVAGDFTSYNGIPCNTLIRLNANGSMDAGFTMAQVVISAFRAILLQPDGKIIIGSARLNSDGSADATYSGQDQGNDMVLQPDGKVVGISASSGLNTNRLFRLNSDGTMDNSFGSFGVINAFNGPLQALAVQPDGKIVVTGNFVTFNGVSRKRFARINTDGSLDAGFELITSNSIITPKTLALQPDGMVVVGAPNSLYRLNTNGTFDAGFPTPSVNGNVLSLCIQSDKKIVAGGNFTMINNTVTANGIARFNGNATAIRNVIGDSDLKVYPNPCTGTLKLELSGVPDQPLSLTVTDAKGSICHQTMITGQSTEVRLAGPAGTYFLVLRSPDGNTRTAITQKL